MQLAIFSLFLVTVCVCLRNASGGSVRRVVIPPEIAKNKQHFSRASQLMTEDFDNDMVDGEFRLISFKLEGGEVVKSVTYYYDRIDKDLIIPGNNCEKTPRELKEYLEEKLPLPGVPDKVKENPIDYVEYFVGNSSWSLAS